jgi:drug/metabolite transporter (DMT)-like permease
LPIAAFLLVLLAAVAHAAWNFLAKRASGCKLLIWFSSSAEALLFLPVAIWAAASSWPNLNVKAALFLIVTGILHLLYTEALLRGYRSGDFSAVYPVARGTGPLLSFSGAVLVLREHLSLLALAGALLVTFGILFSTGGLFALRQKGNRAGLAWGLATGCTIACYTLVDGYSVKTLLISPFLVEYAGNLFRTVLLSFGTFRNRALLATEFRQCAKEACGIALLTPTAYVLVLFAMRIAPISHVAPVREMSMMIGAYLGVRLLKENYGLQRLAGSALIATGVVALALG